MTVKADELRVLLAIAEEGSFRRAAAKLTLSPSGLSHALRSLETRLGVRLVNRTTRSVRLSDAGARLIDQVRPALVAIEDALAEAREGAPTVSGQLRVTATEHGARLLLQRGLAEYQLLYPDVEVELTVEAALVDLVGHGYDAGVRLHDDVPAEMAAIQLSPRASFAVVASPGYLRIRPAPLWPEDLFAHRCLRQRFTSGAVYRWEFNVDGREVTISPHGGLTSNSVAVIVAAALQDGGLGYVPLHHVEVEIDKGALVSVLGDHLSDTGGHSFYYPRARHQTRAFAALVQTLHRYAGQISQLGNEVGAKQQPRAAIR